MISACKILIRQVNWLGDAVMTTPALSLIRQNWPNAELVVLANPLVSQLLQNHVSVDRIITFDRKSRHSGFKGRLRLASELRAENFDLAIILPNSFDSALVPWLARIPVRLGRASDGRSLLLTHRHHRRDNNIQKHAIFDYLNLLEQFCLRGNAPEPILFTAPEEDLHATEILLNKGVIPGQRIVGINAGASFGAAKRWYPERFAGVAAELARRWEASIVLFGGPEEVELVDAIEKALNVYFINLAGKTTVRELMSLIKQCSFLVTNDSGPMHIAAAFGVPLVAVFGPTNHIGTAPYSKKSIIVRNEAACAPCKLRVCNTNHICMDSIQVEQVLEAAYQLESEVLAHKSFCNE